MGNISAEMAEFASNLWKNYIKPKTALEFANYISFYRATVISNSNGTVKVGRPYDDNGGEGFSVNVTSAMSEVAAGEEVLVFVLGKGNASNHLIVSYADGSTPDSGSGGGDGTVTSVTINATSPINVNSAAAITTSGTRTISHATSGATAGSYGDSTAQTPAMGSSFKVPYVTVNATGHVTDISDHNVTLPQTETTLVDTTNPISAGVVYQQVQDLYDYIDDHTGEDGETSSWYGTSSTAATTAAKDITCANYQLRAGALISVTFTTANTVSGAITLNVNSTGAKTVYMNGAATSATNALTWAAGEQVTFIYSGSYYYFVGKSITSSDDDSPVFTALTGWSATAIQYYSGGYYKKGKKVYVNVNVEPDSTGAYLIGTNLPAPFGSAAVALSVARAGMQSVSDSVVFADSAMITSDGKLFVKIGNGSSNYLDVYITGEYYAAE